MTEAVNISMWVCTGSMAAIAVGALLAGVLLSWCEGNAEHDH